MLDLLCDSVIDSRYWHNSISESTFTPVRGKFFFNDYYIDIPLKVNYIFGKKKIRFITSVGAIINIFIKETTKGIFEYEDGLRTRDKSTSTYDYNKLNISPLFSAGIDWKLNARNSLRIEPTYRYGVLKIIDAPLTGYLYSSGLNISYYFGI